MKEIVKVLLEKGIEEDIIHEVLCILEDTPSMIDKKYPKETFDDKEYEKEVHAKNDELKQKHREMKLRQEQSDKERTIGKRPEVKPKSGSWDLFDLDFTAYDTPEQKEYEKKEEKFDRQQRLKNTTKNSRGEQKTTNNQFPEGTDRASRRAVGRRKK